MKYLILIPIIPKLCCCFSIEQEKKRICTVFYTFSWLIQKPLFFSESDNQYAEAILNYGSFISAFWNNKILHYYTTLINKTENQFKIIHNKTYLEKQQKCIITPAKSTIIIIIIQIIIIII